MPAKGMKLKKIYHQACCSQPKARFHSSWKDEDGMCDNCGKEQRYSWIEKKWVKSPSK